MKNGKISLWKNNSICNFVIDQFLLSTLMVSYLNNDFKLTKEITFKKAFYK